MVPAERHIREDRQQVCVVVGQCPNVVAGDVMLPAPAVLEGSRTENVEALQNRRTVILAGENPLRVKSVVEVRSLGIHENEGTTVFGSSASI